MGIDIYAKWYRMTAAERKAQYTGFDITAGNVGYLREAYHGGPYATRVLVPESFAATHNTAAIPAAKLWERLPRVATLVLVREVEVYENKEAQQFLAERGIETVPRVAVQGGDIAELPMMLAHVFAHEVPNARGPERDVTALTLAQVREAAERFPVVASFVAFVALVAQKEQETGRRVRILASY